MEKITHLNPAHQRVKSCVRYLCRIKRVMERDGVNEKKAAKLIKEVDEKRASFHKFYTGKEWEDASQYQLSIDTGKLDISDAADMIINYINAKNIGQKHL